MYVHVYTLYIYNCVYMTSCVCEAAIYNDMYYCYVYMYMQHRVFSSCVGLFPNSRVTCSLSISQWFVASTSVHVFVNAI